MFAIVSLFLLAPAVPGSPFGGVWITPDKSAVEVHACAGGPEVCLRLIHVGDPGAPANDVQNPDAAMRGRKLCGLEIGTGFAPDGSGGAKGGKVYDPQSGRTYSGTLKLDGTDTLKLRGFVGVSLLGRTETWHRVSGTVMGCDGVSRGGR